MRKKRFALNVNGEMTYCSASEENIGKGRCNHIAHQKDNENAIQFMNRISEHKQEEFHDLTKQDNKNDGKKILKTKKEEKISKLKPKPLSIKRSQHKIEKKTPEQIKSELLNRRKDNLVLLSQKEEKKGAIVTASVYGAATAGAAIFFPIPALTAAGLFAVGAAYANHRYNKDIKNYVDNYYEKSEEKHLGDKIVEDIETGRTRLTKILNGGPKGLAVIASAPFAAFIYMKSKIKGTNSNSREESRRNKLIYAFLDSDYL